MANGEIEIEGEGRACEEKERITSDRMQAASRRIPCDDPPRDDLDVLPIQLRLQVATFLAKPSPMSRAAMAALQTRSVRVQGCFQDCAPPQQGDRA